MNHKNMTRRRLLAAASIGTAAAISRNIPAYANFTKRAGKLAILGGEPVRKNGSWPPWPHWDQSVVDSVVKTTKSRIWCRIQSASGTVPT